jgi:hypothetical protein
MEIPSELSAGSIFLVIIVVYILILCVTTLVSGSMWLSKALQMPLKDNYNIIVYSAASNPIGIRKYILDNPSNTLTSDALDKALLHEPTIVFKAISASKANEIVAGLKSQGAVVDAV